MTPVTTEEAFAFHKATGCPILRAIEVLARMEPLLKERVLLACTVYPKRSLMLRDPIESHPATAEFVKQAAIEAKAIVSTSGPLKRGSSHAIWREQARILAERHQITWFSPRQMNPGVLYD